MNKQRDQYKRIFKYMAAAVHLGLLMWVFGHLWYTCYADKIIQPFFRRGNWLVIGIYGVLLLFFTSFYGGYQIGYLKRGDVAYSSCLSILLVDGITYLQVSLIGRDWMDPRPILTAFGLDVVITILWVFLADLAYRKLYPPRELLMLYEDGETAREVARRLASRAEKFHIGQMIRVGTDLEPLYEYIQGYDSVVLCDIKSVRRSTLLKYCYDQGKRIYVTPKISDTILRGAEEVQLFDTPLLLCKNQGLSAEQRFLKRLMDLVGGGIITILASPFMLLTALAIKLYDGGPVIYKQERLTLDGKVFELYKFRSMVVDAEQAQGAMLSTKNDQRITPVGRFIRSVRLDELPQLLNILKGEMSLVGPRPERPEIAQQYEQEMPEFSYRLKVKAGLTGYAQVWGKYNTTPYNKLKMDLNYIQNYSLLLDVKLILMTVKVLFQRERTEGVEQPENTKKETIGSR